MRKSQILAVGYFGMPGKVSRNKTHLVDKDQKPLCAARPKGEFVWCGYYPKIQTAKGYARGYLECSKCRKIAMGFKH